MLLLLWNLGEKCIFKEQFLETINLRFENYKKILYWLLVLAISEEISKIRTVLNPNDFNFLSPFFFSVKWWHGVSDVKCTNSP